MSKHTGEGLIKQISKGSVQEFEATSRDQFEDLIKAMSYLQGETERENKLKEELRNLKGHKKSLIWKKN